MWYSVLLSKRDDDGQNELRRDGFCMDRME